MWGRQEGRGPKDGSSPDPISELRRELISFRERYEAEVSDLRSQNELLKVAITQGEQGRISELRRENLSWRKQSEAELKDLISQNERLSNQIAYILDVAGDLPRERQRLDYVLGEVEGIGKLFVDLRAARQTAVFQSAFDEPSPLVTVVTGTTERPKLLVERCLKSITEQTYKICKY